MLIQLLDIDVKVDSVGFLSVRFNLDRWEEFMAGNFTGENAAAKEGKGWAELVKLKPTVDAIMIQVNKYPKAAKAVGDDEIERKIKVRVLIRSF